MIFFSFWNQYLLSEHFDNFVLNIQTQVTIILHLCARSTVMPFYAKIFQPFRTVLWCLGNIQVKCGQECSIRNESEFVVTWPKWSELAERVGSRHTVRPVYLSPKRLSDHKARCGSSPTSCRFMWINSYLPPIQKLSKCWFKASKCVASLLDPFESRAQEIFDHIAHAPCEK